MHLSEPRRMTLDGYLAPDRGPSERPEYRDGFAAALALPTKNLGRSASNPIDARRRAIRVNVRNAADRSGSRCRR